jgi:hypothetical protein
MKKNFRPGDLVTRPGDDRLWRVTDVYDEHVRLEIVQEAWVRSAMDRLEDLEPAGQVA